MLRTTEEIKGDILNRYEMSWVGIEENMGLINLAKNNFERIVDELIKKSYEEGCKGFQ